MARLIARLQDRLATVLGLDLERRPLVRATLQRPRRDAAGYWHLGIAAARASSMQRIVPRQSPFQAAP